MVSLSDPSISKCCSNFNRVYFLSGGLGRTMNAQINPTYHLTDGIRSFGALALLGLSLVRMTTFGRITAT